MRRFNWQIFISFNLLFTFVLMLLSGLILYFKPEGTVARWLDWKILGVDKSGWESLHTVFSFLFLAFALFHILRIHLRNLRAYMLNYKPRGFRRELYVSLVISVVFLAGTLMYLPPFHLIYQAGNALSDEWAGMVQVESETIVPRHSLEKVATELGMDSKSLKEWMSRQDMEKLSSRATLMEHAENLGITPYTLYERMRSAANQSSYEAEKKIYRTITLEEVAWLYGVEIERIQNYLAQKYDLNRLPAESSLYDISRKAQQTPRDIKRQILDQLQ